MGDFVGGMLKYAKRHPVPRITIAGGFAKMTKLGHGLLDLHSKSGSVYRIWLSELLREAEAPAGLIELCSDANTALLVLQEAEKRAIPIGQFVAKAAWKTAAQVREAPGIPVPRL